MGIHVQPRRHPGGGWSAGAGHRVVTVTSIGKCRDGIVECVGARKIAASGTCLAPAIGEPQPFSSFLTDVHCPVIEAHPLQFMEHW